MSRRSFFLAAILLLGSSPAWAEPYFAAWKGVNCNACHVNQTGGWLRNDFGKNYGNELKTFDWEGISETAQVIRHATPGWVAIGLDIHMGYMAAFDSSLSLGNNQFVGGRRALEVMAKANENVAGVVVLDSLGNFPKFQEVYGLVSGLPEGLYFKMGFFHRSYGLGLADESSLVRVPLGFSFDNDSGYSTGFEVGIFPSPVFLNAALFDNAYGLGQKCFSVRGGVTLSEFTVGGSLYGQSLDWEALGLFDGRFRYAVFGWARLDPVVLLLEYDGGYNGVAPNPAVDVKAYHASLEVDLGGDIFLRGTSEYLETEVPGPNDGFRHVLTLRCYPVRNLKVQLDLARMDPAGMLPESYSAFLDAFVFY
jgi:hypothetical protein